MLMTQVVLGGLIVLALVGHGYLWIGAVNRLHAWSGPRFLIDYPTYLAVLIFFGLPPLVVWHWQQSNIGLFDYFFSQSGVLPRYVQLCVLWCVVRLFLNWYSQLSVNHPSTLLGWRQEKIKTSELKPLPVSGAYSQLLARIPGNQSLQLTVDHKRLAIPRLHPDHEGLTIAHLSDLHMTGRIQQRWFGFLTERVNSLEPDVVAITGDIVEREECWPWLAASIGRLHAKYGVYFILGNHDLFVDSERTRRELVDAGMTCVGGRWIETRWNDGEVMIAGNERPWVADELDQSQLPPRADEQLPLRLVLTHTPDQFGWCCRQVANLVLAGHTHGGQIRFPLLGAVACPSLHGTRYASGVFRRGKTVMHVSRGISGETPLRWLCPPEIALLELARSET